MGDIVPRDQLTKQAMTGVGGLAGGVALLVLRALTGSTVGGLIIGGIAAIVGLVMARDREDRKAGLVALAAGALTILGLAIPGIRGLASTLMLISGIGLLGFGGWSLFKFLRNLKRQG